MSTELIKIDGKGLVFGLEWRALSVSEEEKLEIATNAAEIGATHLVKVSDPDEVDKTAGFLPKAAELKLKGKSYSAAAAFAIIDGVPPESLFLYEDKEQATYYMIGLKGGLPLARFDAVLHTDDEVRQRLADYLDFVGVEPKFFGQSSILNNPYELTLEHLMQAAEAAKKQCLLTTYSKADPVRLAILGIVFVALLAGSYYGFGQYKKAEQRRKAQQAAAAKVIDPVVAYQNSLDEALKTSGTDFVSTVESVKEAVSKLPLNVGGYALEELLCKQNMCTAKWRNKDGTFEDFSREQPSYFVNTQFDLSGGSVTTQLKLKPVQGFVKQSEIKPFIDFVINNGSLFQRLTKLGLSFQLATPEVFGSPAGVDVSQVPKLVKSGQIDLSGPYFLLKALDELPKTITLESMSVRVAEESVQFAAKGKYYVQD